MTQLPGVFQSLAPTLDHYGYLAVGGFVFVEDFGVPLPGETILIAASIYAGAGRLNPILVGVVAVLAAIAGDNVGFAIGHFVGNRVLVRYGSYVRLTPERVEKAERFFQRHGVKVVVIARFVEGLRQANGVIAGATEMPWLRFLPFNALGAVLWVGVWLTIGTVSGSHIDAIYNGINRFFIYVLIGLAALLVAYTLYRRRVRSRRAAAAPAGSTQPAHDEPARDEPARDESAKQLQAEED